MGFKEWLEKPQDTWSVRRLALVKSPMPLGYIDSSHVPEIEQRAHFTTVLNPFIVHCTRMSSPDRPSITTIANAFVDDDSSFKIFINELAQQPKGKATASIIKAAFTAATEKSKTEPKESTRKLWIAYIERAVADWVVYEHIRGIGFGKLAKELTKATGIPFG